MAKKGFFSFVVGTAAVAAGVHLVQKKGGVHVSFDIDAPKLGENANQWKNAVQSIHNFIYGEYYPAS